MSFIEPGCEKKLGVFIDHSLEQEELLPQTVKTAFKGGSADKSCWQRCFPWHPDADVGNRHCVRELHMREGKKEHRRSWGRLCNFNKSPAELWDKVPAGKKPFLDSFCWTSIFLNKQVYTKLHLLVRTTAKPPNID